MAKSLFAYKSMHGEYDGHLVASSPGAWFGCPADLNPPPPDQCCAGQQLNTLWFLLWGGMSKQSHAPSPWTAAAGDRTYEESMF